MLYMIKLSRFPDLLIWFLGNIDSLLLSFIVFVTVECISSVLSALILHKYSIESIAHWIANKCVLFLLIGTANTIDSYLFKNGESLRTITLWFYITYECITIIENTAKLGLPIPQKLIDFVNEILNCIGQNNSDD